MLKRTLFLLLALIIIGAFSMSSCSDDTVGPADDDLTDTSPSTDTQDAVPEIVMLPSQEVRVISVNVAYSRDNMEARGELMIPLLKSYEPDSIGTQENGGYTDWVEFFRDGMPNYARVGRISNGSLETNEHQSGNYIYYNADKYRCLDWNTIWTSETPTRITSYRDSMLRTCTWVVLENVETGFRYVHMNTHLGFENDTVNNFQVELVKEIAERFVDYGFPVFITGDFNTSEGSSSYQIMTKDGLIGDPKYLAEKTMSGGTFRGWDDRDLSGGLPIDFCFVTQDLMDVHEYQIIDTFVDGVALTDHCGIFVNVTVHSLPDTLKSPYIPSTDGITFTELSRRAYVYEFSFTQADDIHLVEEYYLELFDESGNKITDRTILSEHLHKEIPDSRGCTFAALDPETTYTLKLYAVSILGHKSEPITYTFTTSALEQARNDQ